MSRTLALVAVVLVAPLSAGARPAAPAATVIDRTLSCSSAPDPVRKIKVSAVSGFRDPESPPDWKWQPSAAVNSRFTYVVAIYAGGSPDARFRALLIDADRCKASAARVALSTKALAGGSASQLQGSDTYECVVGSRFLVRVRSVFRGSVTLRQQRYFQRRVLAPANAVAAREAQVAVRTLAGKPLAYATASETGKATLFVAPGCVSD